MGTVELKANEWKDFAANHEYAVIDCSGDNCVACLMLEPVYNAVADTLPGIAFGHINWDTYTDNENREPNAIRQMSVFCRRPMYVAANLEKQLEQAYLPRLRPGSRVFYKNMIGQIMEEIDKFPENQRNRPLEPSYLMGYYLQRSALYQKKENEQNEEDSKQ